jgi:hypothetical protein
MLERIRKMYYEDHMSMEMIGRELGKSRQGILYWLHKLPDYRVSERFDVLCDQCGGSFEILRCQWRKSLKHFCCTECYKEYLRNPEYRENRTGQRIGRAVMSEHLGRGLRPGEVVHHVDGDDMNNGLENLMLFKSHGEHLAYHHKMRSMSKS